MRLFFTRRNFLSTGVAPLLAAPQLRAQSEVIPVASLPVRNYESRSTVALTSGDVRRKNVYEALLAIDDQIRPKLRTKKRVLIKPNNVIGVNQLACTHADAIRGVLDYLGPRTKVPITIAESAAGDTWSGFQNFKYPAVVDEFKSQKVELVDFNEDGRFVPQALLDQDAHVVPVRLAARLFDPDAYVISLSLPKSHNYVVATLAVKNMVLGGALHTGPKQTTGSFNHKASYHAGFHLVHYNMLVTAQAMAPYWGAAVIDGYEGMEGNGPGQGTPVPSRMAIASTDFVAADRVGVECMGVDPEWVGYLRYCGQLGVGNYDLGKIDIRGASIASVQKKYRLASDVDRQLQWRGELDVQDGTWIGPRGNRGMGGRGQAGRGEGPRGGR
jgi:uncharacterized protein (DUF362 family)